MEAKRSLRASAPSRKQNPIPAETMRFQVGLPVREANDLALVPEVFRKMR
jgi:hypothetical protein